MNVLKKSSVITIFETFLLSTLILGTTLPFIIALFLPQYYTEYLFIAQIHLVDIPLILTSIFADVLSVWDIVWGILFLLIVLLILLAFSYLGYKAILKKSRFSNGLLTLLLSIDIFMGFLFVFVEPFVGIPNTLIKLTIIYLLYRDRKLELDI